MTTPKRRSPGEGRVEVLPNEQYRAVLRHEGRTRKGRQRPTRALALRDLDALKRRRDEGRWHIDAPDTVRALLRQWLAQKQDKAVNTQQTYRHMIDLLCREMGNVKLERLTPHHIESTLTTLERNGVGSSTRRYVYGVLSAALDYAARRRMIEWNPAVVVERPRHTPAEKQTLTRDQLVRLFDDSQGTPWHALWVVMGTTGLRVSEARALRWRGLDWQSGRYEITEQIQRRSGGGFVYTDLKSASAYRTIALSQTALDALHAHEAIQARQRAECPDWQEKGLIFTSTRGTPLDLSSINRAFRRDCLRQSIDGVTPHSLRHTFVTLLLEAQTPATHVQRWAGHADTRITLDTYGHMSIDRLTDMARRMDAILATPIEAEAEATVIDLREAN